MNKERENYIAPITCVYIYIYINVYIGRERKIERDRENAIKYNAMQCNAMQLSTIQ